MKCKMTTRIEVSEGHPSLPPGQWMEVGYEYEGPAAYKFVRMGCAVPHDDECLQAAGMSDSQIERARRHYGAVSKGILPEDYKPFFAGEMTGYDGKGRTVPGPNASEEAVEEYEELIEDEQDEEAFDDE